jgi:kynurenine formamidase
MATETPLPRYDELPRYEPLSANHAWGVFGADDQLGTINLLTPQRVAQAAREIQRGQMFNLSLPQNLPDPPWSARGSYVHHVFSSNRNTQDDYVDNFYLQSSSQWDSLRHIRAREYGFYNGFSGEDAGPGGSKLGINNWADHGITGRGVLLDVARYMERQGTPLTAQEEYAIQPEMLEAVAEAQGSPLQTGDIILLRTGYIGAYLAGSPEDRVRFKENRDCPGLSSAEPMARYLWDKHPAAICSDNPAVEQVPGSPSLGYLHRRLIPLLGFALGELFTFETLAEDCARDGRYSCFFIGVPLNIPGGVGSPANAMAIK